MKTRSGGRNPELPARPDHLPPAFVHEPMVVVAEQDHVGQIVSINERPSRRVDQSPHPAWLRWLSPSPGMQTAWQQLLTPVQELQAPKPARENHRGPPRANPDAATHPLRTRPIKSGLQTLSKS